jgi:hypothetical protein
LVLDANFDGPIDFHRSWNVSVSDRLAQRNSGHGGGKGRPTIDKRVWLPTGQIFVRAVVSVIA